MRTFYSWERIPSEWLGKSEIEEEISIKELSAFFGFEYVDNIRKRKALSREGLFALELLCRALKYLKISALPLEKDAYGKPRPIARNDLDISIAHSGAFVACAISVADENDREGASVGIDIETAEGRDFLALANRFFTDAELKRFACEGAGRRAFLAIWTKKEALAKLLGTGFSEGISSVDIQRALESQKIFFEEHWLDDEACISLCKLHGEVSEMINA